YEGINLVDTPQPGQYDAIVVAVGHDQFRTLGSAGMRRFGKPLHVLFDVKYLFPKEEVDGRL
ncbi:MAG TPA: Vi polysaccharide biosynthesis UDP-N-acetylglucosamine C-6 dehydrogenase TviB, partial [Pseudomonadales bacterium]|nr:Vi polysaccharide biosynthesis UDP-N-acetylglucosamine C-6 dehydrogenase TviB [Pseudomonadales bacterium]